ncbi:HTH-type transcriptional regulator DmlR [Halomonas sp. THAF5a]|uniref:LysR family transcriptional regulator n=1 Tax=Halomonas sp. THAF5a TaxID=2587844 RepID=UPI0012679DFC|nr:LysR family transcriptional regulator [Halomonas sp. THAF5a]QFU01083.1 HTH-type transcriptional regulator DmlR [Halomonas sp. THAF5a]
MDMPSRLLLLVEVAELGSFTEAAKRRKLDRSVISKHVARLEEELGVRLVNRSTRSLSLTHAGRAMLEQGRSLREWMSNTQTLAENLQGSPQGQLRFNAPGLLGTRLGFEAVRRFRSAYPEVEVEMMLEDRPVDLIGEGFDVALRIGELEASNLVASPLAANHVMIGASPDFLRRHGEPTSLSALSRLPALTWSSHHAEVDYLQYRDAQGALQQITLNSQLRTNEIEVIKRGIIDGLGIGILPACGIDDEVLEGLIVPVMIDLPLERFGMINLLYPHRDVPLRTRLFMQIVKELVGDPPVWEARIPGFATMYGKQSQA